jgi:hypothetical protein
MNKKALVLAIGAALAIPYAYAQKGGGGRGGDGAEPDSVVVLYGRAYPEIVRERGKNPTPASCTTANGCLATFAPAASGTSSIISRNEMGSSNSRFGVRGYEKLGGGWRATWQLETQFLVDSNNTAFAARDSNISAFSCSTLARDMAFSRFVRSSRRGRRSRRQGRSRWTRGPDPNFPIRGCRFRWWA